MTRKTKTANAEERRIDAAIGLRLRQARQLAGISQERLAEVADLSFQQVQKYEKGLNRLSGSRIAQFAAALSVTPDYFFAGAEAETSALPGSRAALIAADEAMRFGHAVRSIANRDARRALILLAEQLAEKPAEEISGPDSIALAPGFIEHAEAALQEAAQ